MNQYTRHNFLIKLTAGTLGVLFPALNSRTANTPNPLSKADMELLGLKIPELIGKDFRLRKEAAGAFQKMRVAAENDGITLYSVSSYRSFQSQLGIWNRKYKRFKSQGLDPKAIIDKIVQYSSVPGTSRHHWGADLDIIDGKRKRPADPLLARHFQENGIYHKLYRWLVEHANSYGFHEVYTNDPKRTGYAYEPWHWSYAKLSMPCLQQYMKINLYNHIKTSKIEGRQYFTQDFIDKFKKEWVLGINPRLIP